MLLLLQFRFSKLHTKACTLPRAVEVFRRDTSRKLPGGLSGRPVVVERLSTFRCVAVPLGRLRHDDEKTENHEINASCALFLASLLSLSCIAIDRNAPKFRQNQQAQTPHYFHARGQHHRATPRCPTIEGCVRCRITSSMGAREFGQGLDECKSSRMLNGYLYCVV